jgi:hypothetical protein
MRSPLLAIIAVLTLTFTACHKHDVIQQADLSFEPPIANPAYPENQGPVVQIDEAHFNFHTAGGRYAPFAKLLRRDGYVVQPSAESVTAAMLGRGDVYVIANAIAESDQGELRLPQEQAFTAAEVEAILAWVEEGGSLLLIADHMPFPAAVEELAAAFDIYFSNGYLYDAEGESMLQFTPDAGLGNHPITEGREPGERVDSVRSFTGQAFRADREVAPLLTVPRGSVLRLPSTAGVFEPDTPTLPAGGMLQGAVFEYGKGRVAVFGEAAMFSAQEQIGGEQRKLMGMNRPDAEQNPQFLLNVPHRLSGLLG